jgi:hypothetical protein
MDVADWLRGLGLERYEVTFRANNVSAGRLPNLTADDLKDFGITSVGHRRYMLEAIALLRHECAPTDSSVRIEASCPSADRLLRGARMDQDAVPVRAAHVRLR